MKERALIAVKEKFPSVECSPYIFIDLILGEDRIKSQTEYGIELPASTRIVRVKAVKNFGNFYVYKLAHKKRHMVRIFSKKHIQDAR
jgi:hypothetical protein